MDEILHVVIGLHVKILTEIVKLLECIYLLNKAIRVHDCDEILSALNILNIDIC